VKKPNIGSFTQKIKNKLKKDSAVFGVTVEVAIQRSTLGTDQLELPTVFRQCIDFLEEHGVNHQGVYRLPGVKSKVEELKSHFDKGEVVDLSEQDPNTVASLLKLYLRELPEPLIPHSSLSGRIDNIFDLSEEEQSEILREVVDTLQTPNRLLLSWLLEHMTHIVGKVHVSMHLFRPH
jgi:RalA-binding protein 1